MSMLTCSDILECLCIYDERNPDYYGFEIRPEKCYCDNCFYGRHDMAVLIIEQQTEISKLRGKLNGTQNPS